MAGIAAATINISVSSSSCFRSSSSVSFSPKLSFCPMRAFPKLSSRSRFQRIYAFSSNDIKVGSNIEVDGAPWRVLEFLHVKPGKGAAFVRTKMRNYVTGNTVQKTFRAGSTSTYEEIRLNASDVGDKTKWLKEGTDCNVLFWNGKVIDFDLPINVKLSVVSVDPGLKGDTAQGGGSKPATVDTGAIVYVPLFVNTGDEIVVDTRTGQYMNRA
ncbi:hypothetical protein AQUCO_04500205v1 [Aquilegia coerulea]|uniref:Translation elongation factor P/YeiP central domain-containing protein n=1 Tax=Aquilegia coerulea TaxID=218851 RepID=A0A2G5CMD0_AQUCA|nr:hypothetical protein AQUCO_04500205v1 [Aquilegia coerulea]